MGEVCEIGEVGEDVEGDDADKKLTVPLGPSFVFVLG